MTYIFDIDGTLIDSMPSFGGAIVKFLESKKTQYPADVVKITTPLGLEGAARYFIDGLGCKSSVNEICEELKNLLYADYKDSIPAKEGVPEALLHLKKLGHSLNVLTASPHATVDVCLKRLELFDLFDNVWSSDDFGLQKSDTRIYEEAAKRLNTTVDKCIFADDNIIAITTAKKAGMSTIGVYDISSESYTDEIKKICDKYIKSFLELI